MNRTDMIDAVAAKAGLTKKQAGEAIDALGEALSSALVKGDKVRYSGLGNFSVTKRDARTGRNPQTGATIEIPAKSTVGFKMAKELSVALGNKA